MLFNSYLFILVFLPTVILGCHWFKQRQFELGSKYWLILASLCFYAWWSIPHTLLMLFSISINYVICQQIFKQLSKSIFYAKQWLISGIAFNLVLLIFFKYTNFLVETVNQVGGQTFSTFNIVLPLAISFFTFQQIAFLVDAYQKKITAPTFSTYVLFISFFPQLIAGPIVHHQEMIPQFEDKKRFRISTQSLAVGLTVFLMGLAKKVGVADSLAPHVDQVFTLTEMGELPTFWEAWIGALGYTLQLYFDFSGYSDMALGLAALFGITLPVNFNSPYQANNIIDFWHRWHMTLSRFLRDYLYIPLGGNRHGNIARYRNLMLTMLLGGLWHGAGINFLLWGGLHGLYLTINHQWQRWCKPNASLLQSRVYQIAAQALTFIAVLWAWVLFRAEDFSSALTYYQALLGKGGIAVPQRLSTVFSEPTQALLSHFVNFDGMFHHQLFHGPMLLGSLACLLLWVLLMPNTIRLLQGSLAGLNLPDTPKGGISVIWRPSLLWAFAMGLVAVSVLTLLSRPSEFIYYQF